LQKVEVFVIWPSLDLTENLTNQTNHQRTEPISVDSV